MLTFIKVTTLKGKPELVNLTNVTTILPRLIFKAGEGKSTATWEAEGSTIMFNCTDVDAEQAYLYAREDLETIHKLIKASS